MSSTCYISTPHPTSLLTPTHTYCHSDKHAHASVVFSHAVFLHDIYFSPSSTLLKPSNQSLQISSTHLTFPGIARLFNVSFTFLGIIYEECISLYLHSISVCKLPDYINSDWSIHLMFLCDDMFKSASILNQHLSFNVNPR